MIVLETVVEDAPDVDAALTTAMLPLQRYAFPHRVYLVTEVHVNKFQTDTDPP